MRDPLEPVPVPGRSGGGEGRHHDVSRGVQAHSLHDHPARYVERAVPRTGDTEGTRAERESGDGHLLHQSEALDGPRRLQPGLGS